MEEEQSALKSFINLHAHKAVIHKERCIYLTKYEPTGIPLNVVLDRYSFDNLLHSYDKDSKINHWVFQQVQTYDIDKEIVIGLEFSKSKILAHVIRLIQDD